VGQGSGEGYILLGFAYAHSGNSTSAMEVWEKALQLDPNLLNIKLNLSSLFIQQRNFEQAEKLLQELQGKDSSLEPEILLNLASLYFAQKEWEKSIQALKKLEQLQPNNYAIKEQMAVVYYHLGDIEHAKEFVQACQQANHPVNPQFLQMLHQEQ